MPNDFWSEVISKDLLTPVLLAMVGVCAIVVFGVGSIVRSLARERTRREIAAYIASGSMTPEQGERLMRAGSDSDDKA